MSSEKKAQKKGSQVNFRVEDELLARIENAAAAEGCSRTELIRRGVLLVLELIEGKAKNPVSAYLDRLSAYLDSRHKPFYFYPRHGFSEQGRTSPYLKPDGGNDGRNDGRNDGKTGEDAEEMEKELQKLAGIINRLIADGLIDVGSKQNQQ